MTTISGLVPAADDEQQEAVEALLEKSGRLTNRVNIRNTFVQGGPQRAPVPGPLHLMLKHHDETGLDLFLLHRAVVSKEVKDGTAGDGWYSFPLEAKVWARALGLSGNADRGTSAVSKVWKRLEEYNLVRRGRDGRLTIVTSLFEDGSGRDYYSPDGKTTAERYLTLPFEYWRAPERWYRELDFPAKAILLIAASLKPGFILPTEKVRDWYGISTESAERGLRQLRQANLLTRNAVIKKAPLSPNGYTQQWHYDLVAPFGRPVHKRRLLVVTGKKAS